MSDDDIQQGNVFWIESSRGDGVEHRCMVASFHHSDSDVVLLPITTWEDWKDDSCLITKQDYAVLTHDSCIDYRFGEICPIEKIKLGLSSGSIKRCPNVSPDLLKKILTGASDSPFLPFGCLNMLNKQGLVD